jgi:hypothetical protein
VIPLMGKVCKFKVSKVITVLDMGLLFACLFVCVFVCLFKEAVSIKTT